MVFNAEALGDDRLEVDAAPPHDAVDLKIGAGFDNRRKLRLFRLAQPRFARRRPMVEKPVRPVGIETMNPIAKGLAVHPSDPGRFLAIIAVAHRRERKQPPALIGVLRALRQSAKLDSRKILAKLDR
jgi:hypothetical protein